MRRGGILFTGASRCDMRFRDDERWFIGLLRGSKSFFDSFSIFAVNFYRFPARCREPCRYILTKCNIGVAVNSDRVIVVYPDEFA